MNYDNMRQLVSALELTETFDMRYVKNACGTPACGIGHAILVMPQSQGEHEDELRHNVPQEVATEWLRLDQKESQILFTPDMQETGFTWVARYSAYGGITQQHAIRVYRDALERGTVDKDIWRRNAPEV